MTNTGNRTVTLVGTTCGLISNPNTSTCQDYVDAEELSTNTLEEGVSIVEETEE